MNGTMWKLPEGPPVSETKIQELEHRLGIKFPESLLDIVRLGDGMRPEKSEIVEAGPDGDHVINALLKLETFDEGGILWSHGVLMDNRTNRVLEGLMESNPGVAYEILDKQAEELVSPFRWVIPIGDNGDGWICLDYRADPDRRACRVVDYSLSPVGGADADGLAPVADNFDVLLSMLK